MTWYEDPEKVASHLDKKAIAAMKAAGMDPGDTEAYQEDPRNLVPTETHQDNCRVHECAKAMSGGWPEGMPPIYVTDGEYGLQIIDGHHRWHAAIICGTRAVPVFYTPYCLLDFLMDDFGYPSGDAMDLLWSYREGRQPLEEGESGGSPGKDQSPRTAWHVTDARNLESILRNGLEPNTPTDANDNLAIYLFPTRDDMETALMQWLGERYNEIEDEQGSPINLVFLEIDMDQVGETYSPVEWEIQVFDPIPTSAIVGVYDEEGNTIETLTEGISLEWNGGWINDGEWIPVDHGSGVHHGHIAASAFDLPRDTSSIDNNMGWWDYTLDHALQNGWIRINMTEGLHYQTIFNAEWQVAPTESDIRTMLRLMGRSSYTEFVFENAERNYVFSDAAEARRFLRRVKRRKGGIPPLTEDRMPSFDELAGVCRMELFPLLMNLHKAEVSFHDDPLQERRLNRMADKALQMMARVTQAWFDEHNDNESVVFKGEPSYSWKRALQASKDSILRMEAAMAGESFRNKMTAISLGLNTWHMNGPMAEHFLTGHQLDSLSNIETADLFNLEEGIEDLSWEVEDPDWAFHGTSINALDGIREYGLLPGHEGMVWFSDSLDWAEEYQGGEAASLLLRFPYPSDAESMMGIMADRDPPATYWREGVVRSAISPEQIEMLAHGGWKPITENITEDTDERHSESPTEIATRVRRWAEETDDIWGGGYPFIHNCFAVAARLAGELKNAGYEAEQMYGTIRDRGDHAWIELDDMVYDVSAMSDGVPFPAKESRKRGYILEESTELVESTENPKYGSRRMFYHVAPCEIRNKIEQEGLDPQAENLWDTDNPSGIYMFDDEDTAQDYGEYRFPEWDMWEIDPTGLEVYEDPEWFQDEDAVVQWDPDVRSIYTTQVIPPDRIRLHRTGQGDFDRNFG